MTVLMESPTSPPSLHSSCKIYFPQLNDIENNDRKGCTNKEFLACNPKEYDRKGGVVVYTHWIEKMESKLETELWKPAMVGAGHATYTNRFHELARLVPHLVTLKNKRIERGESSKDRNGRDNNKRTRTGNDFAIIANPVKREYM
nr:reverse transcriptase domain-containing protein [Tanacetum cinerariifolium]